MRASLQDGRSVKFAAVTSIEDYVQKLQWSPTAYTLAACSVSGPILLIQPDGSITHKWVGHALGSSDISWNWNGTVLASVGQDALVHAHSMKDTCPLWSRKHGATWGEAVAWHPQKEELVVGAGKSVIWLSNDGSPIRIEDDHPSTISSLAWSPSGHAVVVSHYGGATVWFCDGVSWPLSREWEGSSQKSVWSPDGEIVTSGTHDGGLHVWMVYEDDGLLMRGYSGKVNQLSWSTDGRLLASAGGGTIVVWDRSDLRSPKSSMPQVLTEHQAAVTALQFAHSRRLMASGSKDGRLCLWDLDLEDPLLLSLVLPDALLERNTAKPSTISSLSWSPNADILAIGMSDGIILFLQLPQDEH